MGCFGILERSTSVGAEEIVRTEELGVGLTVVDAEEETSGADDVTEPDNSMRPISPGSVLDFEQRR